MPIDATPVVMVVHSDDEFRRAVTRVVATHGATAVGARDAAEALPLLHAHAVSVVVCSFALGEIEDGVDLLHDVAEAAPHTRRALCTDVAGHPRISDAIHIGTVHHIVPTGSGHDGEVGALVAALIADGHLSQRRVAPCW